MLYRVPLIDCQLCTHKQFIWPIIRNWVNLYLNLLLLLHYGESDSVAGGCWRICKRPICIYRTRARPMFPHGTIFQNSWTWQIYKLKLIWIYDMFNILANLYLHRVIIMSRSSECWESGQWFFGISVSGFFVVTNLICIRRMDSIFKISAIVFILCCKSWVSVHAKLLNCRGSLNFVRI